MLRIVDVRKTYPNGTEALRSVSLDIPSGMFGLLGPNGAGKSSLMRTLATLQEPDSGSIWFRDIDVLKQKERVRALLGYLPQEFGLYPHATAVSLLDHFASLKGLIDRHERHERVEHLLHRVNLWHARKKKLGTFSGGMRQRFGIAQALIASPQLVIVDEPTAGLDPEERNRFLSLLANIGEDVVVILSTHIVSDVSDLCSQMAIISNGRVLLSGRPVALIERVRNHVWSRIVAKEDLRDVVERYQVLSTRYIGGQPQIHVYCESSPGEGFVRVDPDLSDLYFRALQDDR